MAKNIALLRELEAADIIIEQLVTLLRDAGVAGNRTFTLRRTERAAAIIDAKNTRIDRKMVLRHGEEAK